MIFFHNYYTSFMQPYRACELNKFAHCLRTNRLLSSLFLIAIEHSSVHHDTQLCFFFFLYRIMWARAYDYCVN